MALKLPPEAHNPDTKYKYEYKCKFSTFHFYRIHLFCYCKLLENYWKYFLPTAVNLLKFTQICRVHHAWVFYFIHNCTAVLCIVGTSCSVCPTWGNHVHLGTSLQE